MMGADLHLVVGFGCTRHPTRDNTHDRWMVYFCANYLVRGLFPIPRGLLASIHRLTRADSTVARVRSLFSTQPMRAIVDWA